VYFTVISLVNRSCSGFGYPHSKLRFVASHISSMIANRSKFHVLWLSSTECPFVHLQHELQM
jgi:hypothetical protein